MVRSKGTASTQLGTPLVHGTSQAGWASTLAGDGSLVVGGASSGSGAHVHYQGRRGLLLSSPERLAFESLEDSQSCCACLPGMAKPLVLQWQHIVGASLDTDKRTGVRVWHVEPRPSGSGPTAKVTHTLRQSDCLECASRDSAMQLLAAIQRTASWGGKALPPNVLVLVNPASGRGNGYDILNNTLIPMLRDAAGLKLDIHMTHGTGHATEILQAVDLDGVDLVLFVGGDGTVFEGVQGLLSRPDWTAAARVPIGVVPSGSGNGLAASFGLWDPVTAAYAACKRATSQLDVASALQPPNKRFYMLLSLAYGLMSNLDIGTEHLRWLGEARFTVGGVREILALKTWRLRAAVWPADDTAPAVDAATTTPPPLPSTAAAAPNGDAVSTRKGAKSSSGGGAANGNGAAAPPNERDRDSLLGRAASSSDDVRHVTPMFDASRPNSRQPSAGQLAPADETAVTSDQVPGYPTGPPLPILSQLAVTGLPATLGGAGGGALPKGWQLLPDEVGEQAQFFMLMNTTHLALNAPMNPVGNHSDGGWELMTTSGLHGWAGRSAGLKMLLATDTGAHVGLDWVKTQRVKALVMEPLAGDSTWLVLDGEQVPRDQPVYIEVHPQLITAIVSPAWPHTTS